MKYPVPSRPLEKHFTKQTLHRSIVAKRQMMGASNISENTFMKTSFSKPLGAFFALLIMITCSAGAYAAVNWFNGSVTVHSSDTTLTVDLSQCTSQLPPGVKSGADRKNVKFKITGSPHIDKDSLQNRLLINCEFDAVVQFYKDTFHLTQPAPIIPAQVTAVDRDYKSITFSYTFAGNKKETSFALPTDTSFFDKGKHASLTTIKPGDFVAFLYHANGDIIERATINSIFKTQYDTRDFLEDAPLFYTQNNILPLDQ